MIDNGGGKCSEVTVMVSGTAATSPCGGTKGVCRHSNAKVSNGTEKECVENVVKSESYLDGEARPPLYRCVLGITASGFYGM